MFAANRSSARRLMPIDASCGLKWTTLSWKIFCSTKLNSQYGRKTHPGKMSSNWTEMAMQHTIPELDRSGLRQFGFTTGAIMVAIFGLLLPWLLDRGWPIWPWIVASPLWAAGCDLSSVVAAHLSWLDAFWSSREPGHDAAYSGHRILPCDYPDLVSTTAGSKRSNATDL